MVQCRYIAAYVIGSSATEAIVVKLGSTPNVRQVQATRRPASTAPVSGASSPLGGGGGGSLFDILTGARRRPPF